MGMKKPHINSPQITLYALSEKNVILNIKSLLLLLYYTQSISLLEGSSVDGGSIIGVYNHTKRTLEACCNSIV